MKERSRNIFVGLTTLGGLLCLAAMLLFFSKLPLLIESSYPLQINIDDANGVANGTRVRLNGVDIGYVRAIRLKDDPAEGVVLFSNIYTRYKVPEGSTVSASAGLLGGTALLQVLPPEHPTKQMLPVDGSATIDGKAANITRDFQQIAKRLDEQLGGQLGKFGEVSAKIGALADEYTAVGQKINGLLTQRDPGDVDAGKAVANVTTLIARADAGMAELRTTIKNINTIVADGKFKESVLESAENTKQLTIDARRQLEKLTTRYVALADDMAKTFAAANQLMEDGRNGKGTLGKLVQDPALYNNIEDAAARLSEALKEMKLLMEKWKAEGLPVHF
jgi:phospholipid/cholesterol/gamma-HCH transport system substrate-binding protein